MSLKIVMCGCAEVGAEMVDYLVANGISISHFVSITEEQAKKNKVSGYCSFDKIARQYNVPIYYPETYSLKSQQDVAFFKKHQFDLLILGGWQRLIPSDILNTLRFGGIGVHGSSEFLPKGRGRSPINWSLIEGRSRFIIHLFKMKPGADDGDVVNYAIFDINQWDTCKTLYYKYAITVKKMLVDCIRNIGSGKIEIKPQQGTPSYYPKRTPEDGNIDWTKTVFQIHDFIRALTHPYPGAFTFLNGEKIFLWKAQPFDTRITYDGSKEGEVVEVFSSGDFVVNCNSGLLLITEADKVPAKGSVFSSV